MKNINNLGSLAYEKLHNNSGKSTRQKFQKWTTAEFESPEITLNKISERKVKYSKGLYDMIHVGKQLTFKLIRPCTKPDELGHHPAEGSLWVADHDDSVYLCYYTNKKGRWALYMKAILAGRILHIISECLG